MTPFSDQMIDQLLSDYKKPDDLLGDQGILKTLTKRLLERALSGELTHHLGYEKHAKDGQNSGNSRNGHSKKTLKGDFGNLDLHIPRDRNGSFQPTIIEKNQTRFDGFDHKILSLYARGLSTREIQGHLEEVYAVEVSPSLISTVTNEVLKDAQEWQNRPLESVYPIIYLDAMRIKIRHDKKIVNKSVTFVMAINMDGQKELLGMWIQQTEGAKFWLQVLTDLKNRGVNDLFIACIDGLSGFPQAIEAAFPNALIQLCIVHMLRNSLNFVTWKDRKAVAADLKNVYRSPTVAEAETKLLEFAEIWDPKYPFISKSWHKHWPNLITFFDYPPEIRRILYTTNPMESVNRAFRKISKTRAVFPNDDAVFKLFFLAVNNISSKWNHPIRDWKAALNRFVIEFGDRVPSF